MPHTSSTPVTTPVAANPTASAFPKTSSPSSSKNSNNNKNNNEHYENYQQHQKSENTFNNNNNRTMMKQFTTSNNNNNNNNNNTAASNNISSSNTNHNHQKKKANSVSFSLPPPPPPLAVLPLPRSLSNTSIAAQQHTLPPSPPSYSSYSSSSAEMTSTASTTAATTTSSASPATTTATTTMMMIDDHPITKYPTGPQFPAMSSTNMYQHQHDHQPNNKNNDNDEDDDDDVNDNYNKKHNNSQKNIQNSTRRPPPPLLSFNLQQQINIYNQSPISRKSNHHFNLHSLLSEHEGGGGCVTVPYLTSSSFKNLCDAIDLQQQQNQDYWNQRPYLQQQATPTPTTKIFFGQLPFVGNLENLIRLMVYSVAGVFNIHRIEVKDKNSDPAATKKILEQHIPGQQKRSANSTSSNKVTCPIVAITVDDNGDADRIIACIDQRVFIDESAFHVAVTRDSVVQMKRYENMNRASWTERFQCRPYTAVTATRENPPGFAHTKGEAPYYKNMRNPICECQECKNYYGTHLNFMPLFSYYLPRWALATSSTTTTQQANIFTLANLVEVHSNMTPESKSRLTEAQRNVCADVSDETRIKVRSVMREKWFGLVGFSDTNNNLANAVVVDYRELYCKNGLEYFWNLLATDYEGCMEFVAGACKN